MLKLLKLIISSSILMTFSAVAANVGKELPVLPEQSATQITVTAPQAKQPEQISQKTQPVEAPQAVQTNKQSSQPEKAAQSTKKVSQSAEAAQINQTDQATASHDPELKVLEFVLANQVVQREPKEIVDNFAEGSEKAFAFARLNVNTTSEVTFVWTRNNRVYTQYTAPIQAAKTWRTYSSIKLKPGDWKVQLLGKNKEVLAEKSFTIK